MIIRVYLMLALSGIAFPSISFAAQCTGSGPKPEWVDSPDSVTSEYFFAAGVSDDPDAPLSERIATAKQNALKSLSEVIQVSVKNSLVLEQSSRKTAGNELTDSNLYSITKTSTDASLRNVESIATWEDKKTCDIWLRIRVSQKQVEEGKREGLAKTLFGMLNAHLATIQNESLTLAARMTAVNAASEVLPRIAFEFLPEASSTSYYSDLLANHRKTLQQSIDDIDQARAALNSSDQLLNKASGQTNEIEKSKTLGEATGLYKNLLAKHGNGLPPVFETGDVLFRLAEIEEMRGSSCGARNYFQQAAESKYINDRRELARKKAESLTCSDEDMDKTLWRQYFESRPTTIICYYKAGSDQGTWNKACDGLNSIIRPLGADISIRAQALSPAQLTELQKGEIPPSLAERGKLVVGIVALGKLRTRADRDPRGSGHEYQFEGGMTSFLMDNGSTVFSDRFQGTTGWNPISKQMVMDVLGINVVKRWREKFAKFLRHDLTQ
ncbi:MAG TPA: LPP20 family lipoprotein [Gallionella sp.]